MPSSYVYLDLKKYSITSRLLRAHKYLDKFEVKQVGTIYSLIGLNRFWCEPNMYYCWLIYCVMHILIGYIYIIYLRSWYANYLCRFKEEPPHDHHKTHPTYSGMWSALRSMRSIHFKSIHRTKSDAPNAPQQCTLNVWMAGNGCATHHPDNIIQKSATKTNRRQPTSVACQHYSKVACRWWWLLTAWTSP